MTKKENQFMKRMMSSRQELEQRYIVALNKLRNNVSSFDNQALKAILNEYEKYKEAMDIAMDEAEELQ